MDTFHAVLVKVLGEKFTINGYLNDVKVKGLWGTGALIHLLTKRWLNEKCLPDVVNLSLEQFMGLSGLNLRTVNNTSLKIKSVAVIDFMLKPNR